MTTFAIFVVMLVFVVARPRGWHEAWWTTGAAVLVIALGRVTPHDALSTVRTGESALLFLFALLALALLVGKSGFFEWAALRCARASGGDGRALYRWVFVLGAAVTALMSLDTTAVMFTPIVIVIAKRLELPITPYVVMCAFVANVGSLLLPISNLTNLLFAETFQLTFVGFALRMALPQLVALATTFLLLRFAFRKELPARCELAKLAAAEIPNRRYFQLCVAVLIAVLVGYFIAPVVGIEAYWITFAALPLLVIAGASTGVLSPGAVTELEWGVFPFAIGLFVVVRAVENLGVIEYAVAWLTGHPHSQLVAVTGGTAVAANALNNLPAALMARSTLAAMHATGSLPLGALLGADIGPMVMPFGSLATILVISVARREGVKMEVSSLIRMGLWMTPVILASALAALWLVEAGGLM
ncbi:arsenical efflux pump membrane protein ArsB [soil metagenome]